ncbi:MAG TPA: hypothetical protein DFK21_16355 [Salmonella bongori]|uniref:Uncharacterized protein n=1 Tax=Salmonella bongori serovar 66:z41:- str. SA19983605 TaxID=1243617 RepID=A0A248K6S9_SALBN|nr:hypothetical protein LFZ56_06650 [Salmonella bongori serovar 66:z41:- str. SA19983605]ECC9752170.1 hypothetical protein [Salmonella bongori]VDZ77672.1 Uncharacterised protein [Salmonella bongori]HAD91820.1 hypothetical protein [Salmonella bongori]HCI35027.1 hypothetical protein [Salmonella bongori]
MKPVGELNVIGVTKRECLQNKWLTKCKMKMKLKLFLTTMEIHSFYFAADIRPASSFLQMIATL